MAYQINFQIKKGSNDLTPYVISYDREHKICSGSATLSVIMSSDVPFTLIQGNTLILKEDGITKAEFFIETTERSDKGGTFTVRCVDGSKWLKDYFISDAMETDINHNARYWAEQILNETGVSYTFNTTNDGIPMEAVITLGLQSAYDSLTTICQQNGWFFYFNSSGTCIIDNITFQPSNFTLTVRHTDALTIQHAKNDNRVRNRAVIWGGTDRVNNEWIFTERFVKTPWARNSHDFRTVLVSNGAIGTQDIANEMAKKLLDEYQFPEYVKIIEVHGFKDIDLGDGIRVKHDFYSGIGMVTSYKVNVSGNRGAITTITLDERCPRLFAYWKPWDYVPFEFPPYVPYYFGEYVYIATDGNGVWRKTLEGGTWTNFSDGLGSNVYVKDLYISFGVFVCIANNGTENSVVYTRYEGDSTWLVFNPTDIIDESVPNSEALVSTDLDPVACIMNQLTNEVEVVYNHSRIARAWHVIVKPFSGGKHVVRQVFSVDPDDDTIIYYNWTAIDIDTNDLDTFILGIQGGTGYALTDGTEEADEITTWLSGDINDGDTGGSHFEHAHTRSIGEHTLEGTSKMNIHHFPLEASSASRYGTFWGYSIDNEYVAVPVYAHTAATQRLYRFNTITEKEETAVLISNTTTSQRSYHGETFGAGVQSAGKGRYIWAEHSSTNQGSENPAIKMYDFNDQSTVTLFTPADSTNIAGPYVVMDSDKEPLVLFFTLSHDGTKVTEFTVHIHDIDAATTNTYNPIDVGTFFSENVVATGSDSFYGGRGANHLFAQCIDYSDDSFYIGLGVVYDTGVQAAGFITRIEVETETVSCLLVEPVEDDGITNEMMLQYDASVDKLYHSMFIGAGDWLAMYSCNGDLTGWTVEYVDADLDESLMVWLDLIGLHISGRGYPRTISKADEQAWSLSTGLVVDEFSAFTSDGYNIGSTRDSINKEEHYTGIDDFNDRLYFIDNPTDSGNYWETTVYHKGTDTPPTTGTIPWKLAKDVETETGSYAFKIIGNIVLWRHENTSYTGFQELVRPRIAYPDTGDVQLLRTNPNINFETVFYADRENNRDGLVGVEISKPNPIMLHGSMTQEDSLLPDRTKGLMYRSDFGISSTQGLGDPNNWLYNVHNEFGHSHVNSMRFYDVFGNILVTASGMKIDPTQLKDVPNRYMIMTSNTGEVFFKSHDNFLGNPNTLHTFTDPVGQVETNNGSFAPHMFVATSGIVPKFYQRLNTQDQFYEKSSGLPGSRIKKIRVDDYF